MSPERIEPLQNLAQVKAVALALFREKLVAQAERDKAQAALTEAQAALKLAQAEKASLEQETQVLLRRISELTLKLAKAESRDQQLALELELQTVQQRLAALNQDTYGSRSERRPVEKKEKKKKKAQRGHGPTPQLKLPVEQLHHNPSEVTCSLCGEQMTDWEGHAQVSQEITVVRRSFKIIEHHAHTFRCTCTNLKTAKTPDRLIPGGRYSVDFAVEVAIEKYADHQPLERQVNRMKREGLQVTSTTLWDQLHALYLLALPTYLALHDQILESELVHADETTWRLMNKGGSKKWWVWGVCTPLAICYLLLPSRSAEAARRVFKDYAGTVMADGYAAYAKLAGERDRNGGVQMLISPEGELSTQLSPNFKLALCWMHARRPFFKAEKAGSKQVGEGLDIIGQLYKVEQETKEAARGDPERLLELRKRDRAAKSKALIDQLYTWAAEQTRVLPKTHFGRGLAFLEKHRTELTRFLEDPKIPLDNGEAERGMRGPVLGRKNHYGSRSERGTQVAAVFYSLIETCKRMQLDPRSYLAALAAKAMTEKGAVLLPSEFAEVTKD